MPRYRATVQRFPETYEYQAANLDAALNVADYYRMIWEQNTPEILLEEIIEGKDSHNGN